MFALADSLLPLLLDCAVKGTMLLVVAGSAAWMFRKYSAAVRHGIWTLACVGLLLLPILSSALPRLRVTIPGWQQPVTKTTAKPANQWSWLLAVDTHQSQRKTPETPGLANGLVPAPIAAPRVAHIATHDNAPPSNAVTWANWIVAAWIGGAALWSMYLLAGFVSLFLLRRRSHQVAGEAMRSMLIELKTQLGIRRNVRLAQSTKRTTPMTWGVFRPIVMLPAGAETWPAQQFRSVLLHELGHVRRWDCLVQTLAQIVRSLFWFHPLAWWAIYRLRTEQERACDDVVLAHDTKASDYAEHLITVAAKVETPMLISPVALAMARSSRLGRRVETILNPSLSRKPMTRSWQSVCVGLALAILLPVSALQLQPAVADEPRAGEPLTLHAPGVQPTEAVPTEQLDEVLKILRERYYKPLDKQKLGEHAIRGMVLGLKDPYSEFIAKNDFDRMMNQMRGGLSGIGVRMRQDDAKRLVVVTPLENSPAFKAGLRPDDVISAVDGNATKGEPLKKIVTWIGGKPGTKVELTVQRDGNIKKVVLKRAPLQLRMVVGFRRGATGKWDYVLDRKNRIGYAAVTQFGTKATDELKSVLADLSKNGLKGLVIDLRDCPGGFLNQAVSICDLFLKSGNIVSTKGPTFAKSWDAQKEGTLKPVPLILLINEHTASAAEIVSGALQDNKRAVLVGTRTFGKGSVQSLIQLSKTGGALRLTVARHYLPSGRNIQKSAGKKKWGVDPNDGYFVPITKKANDARQQAKLRLSLLGAANPQPGPKQLTPAIVRDQLSDTQLAKALQAMQAKIKTGQFEKVGKSNEELNTRLAQMQKLEEMRAELRLRLEEVERELKGLK